MDSDMILGICAAILGIWIIYKFATMKMEDTDEEDDSEEEDADEDTDEDEVNQCFVCGKEIKDGEFISWKSEDISDDFTFNYDILDICKDCIDKKYPREKEVKYEDRFIERPTIKPSYSSDKSKFD